MQKIIHVEKKLWRKEKWLCLRLPRSYKSKSYLLSMNCMFPGSPINWTWNQVVPSYFQQILIIFSCLYLIAHWSYTFILIDLIAFFILSFSYVRIMSKQVFHSSFSILFPKLKHWVSDLLVSCSLFPSIHKNARLCVAIIHYVWWRH